MRTTDRNLSVWNTTFTSINTTLTTLSGGRWVPYYGQMVYLHGFYYNQTASNAGTCSGSNCYSYPYSSVFLDISFQGTENGCVINNPIPPTSSSSSSTGSSGSGTSSGTNSGGSNSPSSTSSSTGSGNSGNHATANSVSMLFVMLSIVLSLLSSV